MLVTKYGVRTISSAKRSNALVQAYFKKPNGTVDEIAKTAMVSRGTLFNYFDNVERLKRYALAYFILDTKFNTEYESIGQRVDKLREYDLFSAWAKLYQDGDRLPIPDVCEAVMFISNKITSELQMQDIIDEYASDKAFMQAFIAFSKQRDKKINTED